MSLISEALKRAQQSKTGKEVSGGGEAVVGSLLDTGIFGGAVSKHNFASKVWIIVGVLSFGLLISVVYSFFLVKKPHPAVKPRLVPAVKAVSPAKPVNAAPALAVSATPAVKETPTIPLMKKEIPPSHQISDSKTPVKLARKVEKVRHGMDALPGVDHRKNNVSSMGARLDVPVIQKAGIQEPLKQAVSRDPVAEAKEAIRAGIRTQKGQDLTEESSSPAPTDSLNVKDSESVAHKTGDFSISSTPAEKPLAQPVRGEKDGAGSKISEKGHNNLGVICYKKGDLNGALDHFLTAIQVNPNNSESYVNLGIVYKKLNRVQDALKAYKQAISLNAAAPESYYNLGILYDDQGDYKRAANAYTQFLRFASSRYESQRQKVQARLMAIQPGQ